MKILRGGGNDVISQEQIQQAVNAYLEDNPVSGMTDEQVHQLNQVVADVAEKLNSNFGSDNAGKYLVVGDDGEIIVSDAPVISDEQVKTAVNAYLEENPVKGGMTDEQEQQLKQNTQDITDLKSALPQKVDREGILGSNKLNVKYGDVQSGYKTDGQKVGWSNIYCTNMIDCSNIYKIHCVEVGGVNSSSVFPAVVFFNELNSVISYVNADVQLNGMYYTFSGTIIVPENAKYVAFNKVKGSTFESQNEIYIVQKKISEEINEINKLTDYTNIKTIKVETSKKLSDAIPCNAKVEISGDPCEVWIYGKNRLPKLPEQSIKSNGVTVSVNKDGEIVLNGTCTATFVGGFLNFSDNIRLEKNKYYLYFEKNDDGFDSAFQIGNLIAYSTLSKRYVETTVEVNQNNIYVSLSNIEQNYVFQDYKILFEVSTEEIPDRVYVSNYPQIITESSVVHIEKGSEIVVFSDGESNVNVSYVYEGDEYSERNGAGNVDKTGVNPEWWGWNLSDGDAFFRYNCDPIKWPQYKEIDSPTLIRGMLVVGKNKKYIGGNSYKNQYPARYGFHIFEGIGRESDNHRLTMLGGHMPNTAAIFYFETPYDGSDENMSDDVYGWLQLGSDVVYTGAMFRPDATRFYVPITFSRMSNEIESSEEKVKVGNKTSEVKTTYEEDTEFKNNATEEDMYPVGTVYYNENLNKLRVHTPSGWKSLAFED